MVGYQQGSKERLVKQPEIREQKAITPPGPKVKGKGNLLPEPSENRSPEGSNLTGCHLSEEGKEQEPSRQEIPKQAVCPLTVASTPTPLPKVCRLGAWRAAPGMQNRDGERSQRKARAGSRIHRPALLPTSR